MKVARKVGTPDAARVLDEVRAAGERGVTAREVAARRGAWGVVAAARCLGKLNSQGLVRTEWTPYKGGPGEPLQEARYWVTGAGLEPAGAGPLPARSGQIGG